MGYPLRRLPVRGGSFWDNHNLGRKAGPEPWHNGEGVALHVANPGSILAPSRVPGQLPNGVLSFWVGIK